MSSSLQPGSRLSHYHVLSPLGSGGMGEVYMAQDESLERAVALKILPAELMKSEERVRRFIQEAKSASSLSHPHIVTIYEIGKAEVRSEEPGGQPHPGAPAIHYIAMELISGETLKQKIHGEKTDLKILLRFLSQAADGLAKAHSAGIIHRDLKPENIMITRDGYAKVLDFGLAKLTERAESGGDPNTALTATREQTREGAVMGTVAYMSPEQVQARPLDFRTDIFSFGSILYEAATRAKPFTADSDLEVMHKILRDKPAPVEELNPDVPAELRRLIRRCLAKSPDQRFQSMKDLSIELGEIAEEYDELSRASGSRISGSGPSGTVTAASGGFSAKLALAAGILIGIAGLGFGIYSWLGRGTAGKAASERFDAMRMTRLTSSGKVERAALSPDGKYLASVVKGPEGYSLWVKQVATGSDVQVARPLPTPFVGVSFSPDGNYLYYVNQETGGPGYSILYQVPVLGGTARKLIFDIDTGVSFSPDGKRMTFMRGYPNLKETALMLANSDGSGEHKLVVRKNTDGFGVVRPSWSPDGKRLAVVLANTRGGPHAEIETVDVGTGKETLLGSTRWVFPFLVPMDFSWLPDGRGLVLTAREEKGARNTQVWLLSYPEGRARRITNDLNQYDGVSVTTDSKTLATLQTNQAANLWASPAGDLRNPRQITFGSRDEDAITDFSLAPDGVLFTAPKGDHASIFSMSLDGSGRTALTPDSSTEFAPRVQKDGKLVFFTTLQEDRLPHVWRMDREGGNRVQVTRGEGEFLASVSPDGRWVLFFKSQAGLSKVATDGGAPVKLADLALLEAQFSPDGTRVANSTYVLEAGLLRRHIEILSAQDGHPATKPIPWPDGRGFRWDPAGDSIVYIKEVNGVDNLWRQPLDGSAAKPITDFTSLEIFSFAWTPGGDQIFLSRGQTTRDVVLITDFH